jgi:schlafen family protein
MPAYYADTIGNFRNTPSDTLELQLTRSYESDRYKDLITAQITAWRNQISALKTALGSQDLNAIDSDEWGIALEFVVPRRMGRIDTVLLVRDAIIALEFKTQTVDSSAAEQVEDYCLDLLYFHAPSHRQSIYPVVVADVGASTPTRNSRLFRELQPTTFVDSAGLARLIASVAVSHSDAAQISIGTWNSGEYRPVPTIVEAAIAMFAEMEVEEIAKAGCDPINLTQTVETIRQLAACAMKQKKKIVCFVTGVPGAGKTLAGLRIVHDRELRDMTSSDSVFLTGNLPLVKVLRAALAGDLARRRKQRLRVTSRDPKTTIDTLLGYKKTHTRSENPPHENIVVFDEAQRAWNAERTAEYLEGASDWIGYSEPELILAILDRHPWALLVGLVGGGQEINRGEAGLSEWGRALTKRFNHWSVAISQQGLAGEYGAGAKLFECETPKNMSVEILPTLHLDNPTRQFRGRTIARWAEALLQGDSVRCRQTLAENPEYFVGLTRRLATGKAWLKSVSLGTERYGCIASSEARRLRAEGLELPPARADGVEHWFLREKGDVRSSYQLETAANEFQIQGLEIDWACICWGGDFLRGQTGWVLKRFRGTHWQNIGQEEARNYVTNSYRVLLTRARQGMVLFVPRGDEADASRPPVPFDTTAQFLIECGARTLDT